MTRRKEHERWETKERNCEVIPQALWLIAKLLMKRDGPKASTAVHGPLGITHHPNEKANVIEDCLENQFTSHELCDENHERVGWRLRVQALLSSVDDTLFRRVRPCDIHKLVNTLKLRKTCGLMVSQTNASVFSLQDHWYI
jgi:hypothetical protein